MAIVATGLQLLAPVLTQRVVDAAAAGHSRPVSLLILLIVVLLSSGSGSACSSGGCSRARRCGRRGALDFVSGRLLQLPLKYFETRRTADIERRLNGLRQVRALFVQGIVAGSRPSASST